MFFRKKNNLLDDKLKELQMNLENNYKDLAISARKEAEDLYAKMKHDGALKEKDLLSYRKRLDDYAEKGDPGQIVFLFTRRQRAVCRCLYTHTATVREREKLAKRLSHRFSILLLEYNIYLLSR